MRINSEIWIKAGVALIILFSFFTFSENFFPLLNSDMAVNILMTPSFSLPHDIYFWGQDRSGNLIPLISHYLYTVSGIKPVIIVSLVHYFILAAGFWALTRFVKTGYGRIVLALLWFLPPLHFREYLLILYGVQVSLVVLALNFLDRSFTTRLQWKCLLWLSASCIVFIIGVWVSDMVLVSILALLITGALYFLSAGKYPLKSLSWRGALVPAFCVLLWAAAGFMVLHYAKSVSTFVQTYDQGLLANPRSIIINIRIVIESVVKVFLFSSESGIESIFAWCLLAFMIFLFFPVNRKLRSLIKITENPWFYFFMAEALLTLAAVLSSRWVAANGAGRRYFTTFFMSACICFVLWLENVPKNRLQVLLQSAFMIIVITASLSGFYRFYYPEIKPSRIRVISALKYMGNIGIIAEYWNAYMTASPDPLRIKVTAHDKDYVRNPDLVNEVFKQPKIYLIKDGWLESFPDTIVQFGRTLKKQGKSFHIADAWLNRYTVVRK